MAVGDLVGHEKVLPPSVLFISSLLSGQSLALANETIPLRLLHLPFD